MACGIFLVISIKKSTVDIPVYIPAMIILFGVLTFINAFVVCCGRECSSWQSLYGVFKIYAA